MFNQQLHRIIYSLGTSYSELYDLEDDGKVQVSITPYKVGEANRGVILSMRDV